MKFSLCLPIAIRANDTQRANMLVQCLESIKAQSYTNYEIILKDALPEGNLTAHSNICKILESWPQLRYLNRADDGVFDGLNQALQIATGDILHFICGDDLLGNSDTLTYVAHQFQMNTPAWIYGSLDTILEDGSAGHWATTPHATLEETLIHNRMGQPAVFWNRKMFEKIGYFDFRYIRAGDYDYWCRCYRVAPPMYTTRLLATGRRWNQSLSHIDCDIVEKEAVAISLEHSAEYASNKELSYVPYL